MPENTTKIDVKIEQSWKDLLQADFETKNFRNLVSFLKDERIVHKIYPPGGQIFSAFELTPVPEVKVVILGQDPYHGHGQANGLCFSVSDGIKSPPSLVNIFKELNSDMNISVSPTGNLEKWARQGVLLLNSILTVRANNAGSHQKKGWEEFTDEVLRKISITNDHLVFMLWGKYAQAKADLIDPGKHLILQAAHPSPFSAHNGFFGCRHFSKTNKYLESHGIEPIDWDLNA
ncbi:MAG TPA: uracil-DNA glycosylase [Flavobacteriales bacterium]|nr:uracil-DNA glycosylase [Flavobacteriales bacterium]